MSPSSAGEKEPATDIVDSINTKQQIRAGVRQILAFNVVAKEIKVSLATNILNAFTRDYLKPR